MGGERRYYVYLLRCADGSLYCGWTVDPAARLAAHNSGRGAKYTRSRRPAEMIYTETAESRSAALRREWQIKHMSRAAKEKLVSAANRQNESEPGNPVRLQGEGQLPRNLAAPDHSKDR